MVGRQQKDPNDEIEETEEPLRRRALKTLKLKKTQKEPEISKQPQADSDADILAEIGDLEGVSEAEKNDIKQAILLSRRMEQQGHMRAVEDEGKETATNSHEDLPQQQQEEYAPIGDTMDYDETQPPDSPVKDNSSVDKKQDRLSMSRTKDGPDGSIYERSTIIDGEDTGGVASPTLDYDLNISVTQEELDDLEKDHETQQDCEKQNVKSQSPQFSKMFATKPKPGNVDSTENQHISDQSAYRVEKSESSSGSVMDEEAKTCQLSEGSQEFVVHNETEVEQGNQASEEHENQASEKHGSGDVNVSLSPTLKRHYRNVKNKNIHTCQQRYFSTDQIDPVLCTKAILQLFDTYAKNLRAAQAKLQERMPWGVPIKSGQHQSRTIDMKRRGQESQYMLLSDSEEDEDKSDKSKTDHIDAGKCQERKNESETTGRRRRARNVSNGDANTSAGTQPYDLFDFEDRNRNQNSDDFDDKDFLPDVSVRLSKQRGRQNNPVDSRSNKGSVARVNGKDEIKKARGRPKRVKGKILVEDTQKDLYDISSDEDVKGDKENVQVVVEESQLSDTENMTNTENKQLRNNVKQRVKSKTDMQSLLNQQKETYCDSTKTDIDANKRERNTNTTSENRSNPNPNPKLKSNCKGQRKKRDPLVEDTQDMDSDMQKTEDAKIATKSVRGKRKSFQLKSDSEEENSIPETQEMDLSPDITVIEKKTSDIEEETDQKDKGIFVSTIGSVFNKIKDYISPKAKVKDDAESSQHLDDEESQSPIIKKRRRLYKDPDSKFDKAPKEINKKIDFQDVRETNGNFRGKRGAGNIEFEKMNDLNSGKGAERLMSRPLSKESNTSDEVSITASQGSSTFLDEQGDLYCTQINEKPDEYRQTRLQRTNKAAIHSENSHANFDDIRQNNGANVLRVKSVKKDYSGRKAYSKKPGIITLQSESIENFFPKAAQKKVVISCDSDSDDPESPIRPSRTGHNDNTNSSGKHKISQQLDDENPVNGLNEKSKVSRKNITTVPRIKVPRTDNSVAETHNLVTENGPVKPSHFIDRLNASCKESSQCFGGARPKVARTRKVSETITSGELEETNTRLNRKKPTEWVTEHFNIDQTEAELDGSLKKMRSGKVSAVVRIPCPLCNQKFSEELIEIHASECVGMEEGDEEEPLEAFEEVIAHRLQGHTLRVDDEVTSPSNRRVNHLSNNLPHHVNDVHLPDYEDEDEDLHGYMNMHASQKSVRVEDSDIHAVAKDIKISPGEPGELQSCYVCDAMMVKCSVLEQHIQHCLLEAKQQQMIKYISVNFRELQSCYVCDAMMVKGSVLEQHIQHCLLEAKQQQMEVDKEGFNKVFGRVQQPAEPDTPRTTRRQMRHKENLVTIRVDTSGNIQKEDGYSSGDSGSSGGTSYGSSWSESSESDSSVEENVMLASIARPKGPSALITGPWNKQQTTNKQVRQSIDRVPVPDWVNNPSNSPIKSFVPISQQEDTEYFSRQFQYKKERVERNMAKRKRGQSRKKGRRRRKRRKVSKKTSKSKASKL